MISVLLVVAVVGSSRHSTIFMKVSASTSRPLKVLPCFVSIMRATPMKCLNKGARSDADLFGLFWLGGLLDMMRGGERRYSQIQLAASRTQH